MLNLFINTYIKFFFLLTPFFLLSTFLAMTRDFDSARKKKIALKATLSIIIVCIILFLIGNQIFMVFGITLNSFRIGTGILLFFSAYTMVQGPKFEQPRHGTEDFAVVPLAIPMAVGPATTGALLVMGGELGGWIDRVVGIVALLLAVVSVGAFLYLSGYVERLVKREGLSILSKITGLILAALAAQMVMIGMLGFLGR